MDWSLCALEQKPKQQTHQSIYAYRRMVDTSVSPHNPIMSLVVLAQTPSFSGLRYIRKFSDAVVLFSFRRTSNHIAHD